MIKKHQIDLLCIQKIKKEQIEKAICQALWGDPEVSWEMYLASNTAGGLLCLWSEKACREGILSGSLLKIEGKEL